MHTVGFPGKRLSDVCALKLIYYQLWNPYFNLYKTLGGEI